MTGTDPCYVSFVIILAELRFALRFENKDA